jgi:hypothetical protein
VKINFSTMTDDERTTALAALDNPALAASLAEARTEAAALFALTEPTIEQVNDAEALLASIGVIETEQAAREAAATDAASRFAAARATFAGEDEVEASADEEVEASVEDEGGDTEDEGDESDEDDTEDDGTDDGEGEGEAAVTAANHTTSQRIKASAKVGSTARKVGAKTKRPARKASNPVTITAAADVPGFSMGSALNGMTEVAAAVQARAGGFAPFNQRAADQTRSQSQGQPVLHKFGVASFAVPSTNDLTVKSGVAAEYDAVGEAVKAHVERVNASLDASLSGNQAAMAAAMMWCAPSEVVYNWIADFVVDGLFDLPEISAPRGGLMLTEGPRLAQEGYGTEEDFGFGGTETEMEAGYVKTCETIECPDFVDYRLDFDGYCWKIPILTEKTFPELVADALKTSDVLYAHKMNKRIIGDVIAGSVARNATNLYGGSVLDTLEALVQIATKERRFWNVGVNAVMEVKMPQHALDIFKIDMQRRSGLALSDIATEQRVNAYFANHKLSVKYLSDFDERSGSTHPTADWPDTIRAIMYPAGTFVKAQFDVINLSAVYDAASLSLNEYTGVFYEQGIKVIRRGYRSSVVTVPVCTAGAMGGLLPTCSAQDSF